MNSSKEWDSDQLAGAAVNKELQEQPYKNKNTRNNTSNKGQKQVRRESYPSFLFGTNLLSLYQQESGF